MKMDYSVTRQLSSKIPDKASTEQIKAGLERIKKAQEQVLQQLKRNHPDYSIDVRTTNSQALHQRRLQNQNLKHQLDIEREKSTEKSTLYRRRVVDLQASLTAHERNQQRLTMEIKQLEAQLRDWRQKYGDLQRDYQKLVNQSEVSTRNVRNLQKQVMELVAKLKSEDTAKLKTQLQGINIERNTIMAEKVNLLKTNSRLQSENIQLKHQISTLANKLTLPSSQSSLQSNTLSPQSISFFLNEIHRMNSCHELIFTTLKSNTKLSRTLIDKQNAYQNSLNKILEMLVHIQRGESVEGGVLEYRFDHENMYRQELQRVENELTKKFKKQTLKLNMEKDELNSRHKIKDKKIQQLNQQKQQSEQKILQLRKQKSQLLNELASLTSQLSSQKSELEQQQKQKMQQLLNQQKSKDKEYNQIINQVNEQMITIQKQKKDLEVLINKMTSNKSKSEEDDNRNKKQLGKIMEINTKIQDENQKIQQKYQTILMQKQTLFVTLNALQSKFEIQNREIAKEVLQKEKLITELNRLKQQHDVNLIETKKFKLLSETTKTECQQVNNSYLLEIQRLIHDGLHLRQEIQMLNRDRAELRDLKGKYGLLVKDNQILGKKARNLNGQVDHLWMIKEIEYQNVHKVITELKPL